MASLIKTWKRLVAVSEKNGQSIRPDTRVVGRNGNAAQRKTSAERAVERLAEKKDILHLGSSDVKSHLSEQKSLITDAEKEAEKIEMSETAATVIERKSILTAEEMKKVIEEAVLEANHTEEIKEFLAQRFSIVEGQIVSIRNVQKQEMIVTAVQEVREKVDLIRLETRKIGNLRFMLGISILGNLVTLAVLVAYVLHLI